MSDDEARGDVPAALRAGTGPRHAAPKKPLLTRLHVPAGKAIALAAMPTAVLMGMGFTPTLARAEDHPAASNSQQAEEYKKCVAALAGDDDASASPSPSASASASKSAASDDKGDKGGKGDKGDKADDAKAGKGDSGSSDSGSDGKTGPSPSPSASASSAAGESGAGAASPSPSPSASASEKSDGGGLLETIGDAITDIFTGGSTAGDAKGAESSPSPSPSASASAGSGSGDVKKETPEPSSSPKASEGAGKGDGKDEGKGDEKGDEKDDEKASASPSPSPSASAGKDLDDCKVATDAVADGRDNKILLPEDPWILEATGLTLDGADYEGIVEVTTSSGKKKKVLKYVVSKSTKIVDLHQIVHDKNSGKTYHVRSAKGKESTIDGGTTTMYTESISGNLFGLFPVTFTPDNPPPLNIPWIYFSNVKVVQAGQFGGTLHIPGMNQSIT